MLPLVSHSALAMFQGLPEGAASGSSTNDWHAQDAAAKMVTCPRPNIHGGQTHSNSGHS